MKLIYFRRMGSQSNPRDIPQIQQRNLKSAHRRRSFLFPYETCLYIQYARPGISEGGCFRARFNPRCRRCERESGFAFGSCRNGKIFSQILATEMFKIFRNIDALISMFEHFRHQYYILRITRTPKLPTPQSIWTFLFIVYRRLDPPREIPIERVDKVNRGDDATSIQG